MRQRSKFFIILLLQVVFFFNFSSAIQAQGQSVSDWIRQGIETVKRKLGKSPSTSPESRPQRPTVQQHRVRGGRRELNEPLTALIPHEELALTVAARPAFFFYIPDTPVEAEFVLLDKNDVLVYKTDFTIIEPSGILNLSLPEDSPPLEVGTEYHWYFLVMSNQEERSAEFIVEGWVQRVEPSVSLIEELENTSPQLHPHIYAAAGIWYDALASLAELRRAAPEDPELAQQWEELLEAIGLCTITAEPLVN